jgi:hypothetical protein
VSRGRGERFLWRRLGGDRECLEESSTSFCQLGNRPGMSLKTLRVWRLTLPPSAPSPANSDNKEKGDDWNLLDREKMARAVEINVMTGASHRCVDSIHGIEPGSWSHFWATGA